MSLVATDYAPVYLIDTLPSPYRHDLKSAAPPISRPQNRLDLSTDRILAVLFPLRGRTHVYFPENFSSPPPKTAIEKIRENSNASILMQNFV